jgi:hypothetical protein
MKLNLTHAYITSLVWSGVVGAVLFACQALRAPIFLAVPIAGSIWVVGMVRIWIAATGKP